MTGFTTEYREHTAIVTIDNPPANTWTEESLAALETLVAQLNSDSNIRSLVITGQGEKFFSAGADLKMFASGDKEVAQRASRIFGRSFTALSQFNGVSIAAINGYAMGGGLEAAMACDFRIAEEQCQMALPEAKVGLLPCGLGTQTLTRLVGEPWAKKMILLGMRIDSLRALDIGLVDEVCATGESLDKALAMATAASRQSPVSITKCKTLIQATRSTDMMTALVSEREAFVDLFDYSDTVEGVNAFLEKRAPNWSNR